MEDDRIGNKKLLVAWSNEECWKVYRRIEASVEKLKLSKISEKPWTHLMLDFITKLPLVAGKNAILVVCNRLSKMTYFVATTEGTSVERLARLFRDNVWKLHRLSKSVVSDKGPQFAVEMTKKLNKILGIETKLLTSFHPQTARELVLVWGLYCCLRAMNLAHARKWL